MIKMGAEFFFADSAIAEKLSENFAATSSIDGYDRIFFSF